MNGIKTFKLTMTGGTITEGLGCGGGQGYAHTDSSYVKISNATLAAFYGILSNGSARTIKAELDNCTFSAIGESTNLRLSIEVKPVILILLLEVVRLIIWIRFMPI